MKSRLLGGRKYNEIWRCETKEKIGRDRSRETSFPRPDTIVAQATNL